MKNLQYNDNWTVDGMSLIDHSYKEIVMDDVYKLGWFKEHVSTKIKTFIDIGANIGVSAIFANKLFPQARIIAIEPCVETFKVLEENTQSLNIERYNFAFGNGKPLYCMQSEFHSGANIFIEQPKESKPVASKTLKTIIHEYAIKKPYIIKMDIEGGEYFLMHNNNDHYYVVNAAHFAVELHFSNATVRNIWEQWTNDFFSVSHHITRKYTKDGNGAVFTMTRSKK
jgi:FkbM family methyltransferase